MSVVPYHDEPVHIRLGNLPDANPNLREENRPLRKLNNRNFANALQHTIKERGFFPGIGRSIYSFFHPRPKINAPPRLKIGTNFSLVSQDINPNAEDFTSTNTNAEVLRKTRKQRTNVKQQNLFKRVQYILKTGIPIDGYKEILEARNIEEIGQGKFEVRPNNNSSESLYQYKIDILNEILTLILSSISLTVNSAISVWGNPGKIAHLYRIMVSKEEKEKFITKIGELTQELYNEMRLKDKSEKNYANVPVAYQKRALHGEVPYKKRYDYMSAYTRLKDFKKRPEIFLEESLEFMKDGIGPDELGKSISKFWFYYSKGLGNNNPFFYFLPENMRKIFAPRTLPYYLEPKIKMNERISLQRGGVGFEFAGTIPALIISYLVGFLISLPIFRLIGAVAFYKGRTKELKQIEIFKVLHDTLFAGGFIFQPGVKEKLNFYNLTTEHIDLLFKTGEKQGAFLEMNEKEFKEYIIKFIGKGVFETEERNLNKGELLLCKISPDDQVATEVFFEEYIDDRSIADLYHGRYSTMAERKIHGKTRDNRDVFFLDELCEGPLDSIVGLDLPQGSESAAGVGLSEGPESAGVERRLSTGGRSFTKKSKKVRGRR